MVCIYSFLLCRSIRSTMCLPSRLFFFFFGSFSLLSIASHAYARTARYWRAFNATYIGGPQHETTAMSLC